MAVVAPAVLGRSAIVVWSKLLVAFLCCNFFLVFCGCKGFCYRTASDLLLFLYVTIHFILLMSTVDCILMYNNNSGNLYLHELISCGGSY